MKYIILTILILISSATASDKLIFGAITTVEPELVKKSLLPIIKSIEIATGKKVEFKTGYNYTNTINKFADGTFDIGYIGPAPYIKTKLLNPSSIDIIVGLKNEKNNPFQSVIITKKGSPITKLSDINNHTFAFGSPESTLSYFVPMNMLIKSNVTKKISSYSFLGLHDKVAQYIIMEKYDLGAVKRSVADKYSKYIQVVAKSEPLVDFMIVANSSLDKKTVDKIKTALLNLKDEKGFLEFEDRKDSDYDNLRKIILNVENLK